MLLNKMFLTLTPTFSSTERLCQRKLADYQKKKEERKKKNIYSLQHVEVPRPRGEKCNFIRFKALYFSLLCCHYFYSNFWSIYISFLHRKELFPNYGCTGVVLILDIEPTFHNRICSLSLFDGEFRQTKAEL